VRREAAIRIDLVRGKGQNGAFGGGGGEPFERREKKRDVGAALFELAVVGHDVEHNSIRLGLRRGRNEQRFCRTGQSRDGACRDIHAAARSRRLQDGPKIQRCCRGHAETPSVAS
jgi:hypothetical protein